MLKGNVTIELYKGDKLIQKESSTNMVTNAVEKILGMAPWCSSEPYYMFPLAQKLLGGLYLFDNVLTEDRNNTFVPSDAKLIGIGGRLENTLHEMRGTFNALESGPVDNGFKNVWDFNENQANGIIKSASLTSMQAGDGYTLYSGSMPQPFDKDVTHLCNVDKLSDYGFIDKTVGTNAHTSACGPLYFDENEQIIYYWFARNVSTNEKYIDFYKRKMPLNKFGVNDGGNPGDIDLVYPRELIGSYRMTSSYLPTINNVYFGYDGFVYVIRMYGYAGQTKIDAISIDIDELMNGNVVATELLSDFAFGNDNYAAYASAVSDHYLYLSGKTNTGEKVYRYDLLDMRNYIEYETKNSIESTRTLVGSPNGIVYETVISNDNNKEARILYPDGTFKKLPGMTGITATEAYDYKQYDMGLLRIIYENNRKKFYVRKDYLGTIFNFPNPINKDNSTCMKVSYTLTNV